MTSSIYSSLIGSGQNPPSSPSESVNGSFSELCSLQRDQIALLQTQRAQNETLIALLTSIDEEQGSPDSKGRWIIGDIDIPFWSLVGFLIKLSIASIPAAIVIAILYFLIILIAGGAFGGALSILRGIVR